MSTEKELEQMQNALTFISIHSTPIKVLSYLYNPKSRHSWLKLMCNKIK